MSSITPNNTDQEIDLRQVSQKMGQAYESFLSWIFRGFLFVKRNLIVLIVLFVLGAGIGFYLDKDSKVYESKIIVTSNFGSINYLYSKVELLQSKIVQGDISYLKSCSIENIKSIAEIKVEPIIDIYPFINGNPQNFEFVKLLAEDKNITEVIENQVTSKNYPYHSISLFTKNKINDNTITSFVDFLNNNDFYNKIQKESFENLKFKIRENDTIINQINRILNKFLITNAGNNLIYNNENNQLNDIIKTKENMILTQANLKIELLTLDKTIKESTHFANFTVHKSLNKNKIFYFPILLIFSYLFLVTVIKFYKTQQKKLILAN